jgi:hypothetical protein
MDGRRSRVWWLFLPRAPRSYQSGGKPRALHRRFLNREVGRTAKWSAVAGPYVLPTSFVIGGDNHYSFTGRASSTPKGVAANSGGPLPALVLFRALVNPSRRADAEPWWVEASGVPTAPALNPPQPLPTAASLGTEKTTQEQGDREKLPKRRLQPNSKFVGAEYEFTTDSKGRTWKANFQLKLKKGPRSAHYQRMAGRGDGRLASDVGGHLKAAQFEGPKFAFNHVPMDAKLNSSHRVLGKWGQLETKWANALSLA